MKTFLAVIAIALTVLISGCVTEPVCGDGSCDTGECFKSCPSDCEVPIPPEPPEQYTYTYEAKFEPPEGRILHGMGQFSGGNEDYIEMLVDGLKPASSLKFISVGKGTRPWDSMKDSVRNYFGYEYSEGRIPSLEMHMFDVEKKYSGSSEEYFAIDDEVAQTDKYDSKIRDIAQIAKKHGKPIFMRIGGEFSGSWNGYHPYEYPKAFRKAVDIFREEGADNVAFIWCYMPSAPGDFDEKNAQGEWKWFPGDDVIDWYSIDVFKASHFSGPLTVGNGLTANGKTDKFLKMAEEHGKPVILAETSAASVNMTDDYQDGVSDWNQYFVPFFEFVEKYPVIKGFHYINYNWPETPHYGEQGWMQASININSYISQKYKEELEKDKYLHTDEIGKLKDHWKYK